MSRFLLPHAAVVAFCCSFFSSNLHAQATTVTATKTDTILVPNPNSRVTPGAIAPGGNIRYNNVITNTGANPATGVTFQETTPTNTTMVAGSVNVSPLAINDSYTAVGNTLLRAGGSTGTGPEAYTANGVNFNDQEFLSDTAEIFSVQGFTLATDTDPVDLTSIHITTPQGGTLVINVTTGNFTYLPAVNFTGVDTFTYVWRDNGTDAVAGNADDLSDTATVTITVSNKVWYVNNAAGTGGDGRSSSPFDALSDVSGASGADVAGDIIFVQTGGASYTGGITLLNTQTLWGENEALVVGGYTLRTAGADPVITNAAGNGVTLASGNTLKGFTVANTTTGDIVGTAVGTLTVSNVISNGTGPIFTVSTSGALAVTLDSASTTSASTGISLTGCTGTFTSTAGAISGVTGTDVFISGGTATVSIANSITSNTGGSIEVTGRGAGANNITFSGALNITGGTGPFIHDNTVGTVLFSNASKVINTGTGAAVNLTTNLGATIDFTGGGLDIDTTSGIGFNATGGGTVNITGTVNTITSTTGIALNVANTTIGASNLNFQSIATNGASSGIVLNTTSSSGGLIVTGTGSAGSGGTIQNTTSHGISLTSTQNVRLSRMNITNNLGSGISGSTINGFLLDGVSITGNGNDAGTDESGINVTEVTGTAFIGARPTGIINSTISNNNEFEVQITNTTGTLTDFQMSNNTISSNGDPINGNVTSPHGNLVNFLAVGAGTTNMTLNVTSGAFTGNTDSSGGKTITATGVQCDHSGSGGTMTANISGATFTNNNVGPQASVAVNGTVVVDFNNNNIQGSRSTAINLFADANPPFTKSITGKIRNNIIGTQGVTGSGASVGFPIRVQNEGRVPMTLAITGNTVQESVSFTGINVNYGISVVAGNAPLNLTITGNTIREIDSGRAILVQQLDHLPAGGNAGTVNATISGNIISNVAGQAGDGTYIRVRRSSNSATAVFNVTQTQPTASAIAAELDDANGFNDLARLSIAGTPTFGAAAPPLPPLLFAPGELESIGLGTPDSVSSAIAWSDVVRLREEHNNVDVPPVVSATDVIFAATNKYEEVSKVLSQAQLDSLVSAARARWEATDLSDEQLAILNKLTFSVADLPGWHLGQAEGNTIRISNNAGGNNWFVDLTPSDDVEFSREAAVTRRASLAEDPALNRVDLLTTLMHEMGHALGLGDRYDVKDRDSIMFGFLTKGERRLPSKGEAGNAKPFGDTTTRFLDSDIDIDNLPVGKSVTIVYDVRVDSPTTTTSISCQGTVVGTNIGASVLTNTTNTPVEQPPTVGNLANSVNEDVTMTFAATSFDAGFTDPNSDTPKTVRITSLPGLGTLQISGVPIVVGDLPVNILRANLGTLTYVPPANTFGSTSFGWTASDGATFAITPALFNITVNPVADTPSITNATTNEDTQTTSGLVISRNAADSTEVTHFKITGITNGTLFQNNGTTVIPNNSFITFAEANAGLKFTPTVNFFGNANVTVQASLSNLDAGLGGSTVNATITVSAVADTPSITNATTNENTQSTTGLVISRNAGDSTEVTHFKITGITNGTLFQNNGTTPINNNDFITFAQANAGLKFTPTLNFFGTANITIQASLSALDAGLGGNTVQASITVTPLASTPSVTNATTNEDTQTTSGLVISRNVGDGNEVTHFKITAITNGTLFQNDGTTPIGNGNFITFAEGNAGLKFTPAANSISNGSFTVQASVSNADAGIGGSSVNATITVNPVADTPSVTNATTLENTQTTSGLVVSRNAVDGTEVTHFKITGITDGTLFRNDGTTPIANNEFITFAVANAGLKFTPTTNFFGTANFTLQASLSALDAGLGGSTVQASITVTGVASTPSVTNATTNEDTQTTSGLVISRNAGDGNEVTHFKITSISNGSLFQNNGTTPITNGSFITFAEGNAGLKFTPAANFFGNGSFTVQASVSNVDAGLGGSTVNATITVSGVADTPSITSATTLENTQTTSGLVVSRNAADGTEVTHFKITNILNGSLFQNDGVTPITAGSFLTFAQANAGLKFTPTTNFSGTGNFDVQSSLNGNDTGLGGSIATAAITVNPVANTPAITNATTNEDTQTTSGLVVTRNAVDGAEVTHFKVTGISNGSLFQNDGTTAIANNDFITFAQANAGLKFTPTANFFGSANVTVQASVSNVDAGLGGSTVSATITVNAVADTPSVTNATTAEDVQTTSGLVISRNVADGAEVTHFKITNILNGSLFQNDGTTSIAAGSFITFAEANAGLKFTPSANFSGNGSFDVQASLSNADAGLGGSVATTTITVSAVADTPSITNASTLPNTQTTSGLVVSRNAADGAEVTHFQITNIANGTLFQNNGTTPIANNDFITFAQANAGLKFTPAPAFAGVATFDVQASVSNSAPGLGGGVITANIAVANYVSVATLNAGDNTADESGNTGVFTFTRGTTNGVLVADFQLDPSSTASAVTDFTLAGGSVTLNTGTGAGTVTFPDTVSTVVVTLTATPEAPIAAEAAETVRLNVVPQVGVYIAGPSPDATVTIAENGFLVTTTNDAGYGSLRQAIANANSLAGDDVITFDPAVIGTITLTSGQLSITSNVTIQGPGANVLAVSGNNASRVIDIPNLAINVTLNDLTFSNGAVTDENGAGIRCWSTGSLTITRCAISQNTLTNTGGSVEHGGGIARENGTLTMRNSTVSGNQIITSSGGIGGGLSFSVTTATLTNCTFSGNSATQGGALLFSGGSSSLVNVTITGNTAAINGGGIFIDPFSPISIGNSIVAGNTAASQSDIETNTLITTLGNNLIGDGSGSGLTNGVNSDQVGTTATPINPLLGPLANNGGPTLTHALLDGSPAINAGNNTLATNAGLTTDQRGAGFPRVQGPTVDIGALEALLFTPTLTNATTNEDVQSSSGLIITANTADAGGTTHYKITNIAGGLLFKNDGTTAIAAGSFITKAEGSAGLKFSPTANLNSPGTSFGFDVQASLSNADIDLRGSLVPAVITVNAIADTPTVTDSSTTQNTQTTTGLIITKNAVDGAEVTHYKITAITNGTLYQNDGTTAIAANSFITVAEGSAGLKFTPTPAFIGVASFGVQASQSNLDAGLGGSVVTASINVGTPEPTIPVAPATFTTRNSQNGLAELVVTVQNTTAFPINGFRLFVDYSAYLGGYPTLKLYNATSPSNVSPPYIDYPFPMAVGQSVSVTLQFYTVNRMMPNPFVPVLTLQSLAASQVSHLNDTGVPVTKIVTLPGGSMLLEFNTIPKDWYRVSYSSDMVNWFYSPVPIQAGSSKTQWIDNGAPGTDSHPNTVLSRFYRVSKIPAP